MAGSRHFIELCLLESAHCLCRGVLNVVHGTHGAVNSILDHPDIKAVSFVGSDKAGRYIFEVRGSGCSPMFCVSLRFFFTALSQNTKDPYSVFAGGVSNAPAARDCSRQACAEQHGCQEPRGGDARCGCGLHSESPDRCAFCSSSCSKRILAM